MESGHRRHHGEDSQERRSPPVSYIQAEQLTEQEYPTFAAIKQAFGFIPNFFRAQTSRKDLIDAEVGLIGTAMIKEGALSRRQKEYIFLAVSARNLSTYCVTAHCEIVRMLKIEGPEPEQVAIDHTATRIPFGDKALLNFVLKLNHDASSIEPADIDGLRTFGFSDQHILEAVIMTGLAQFANTVSFGLGTLPDFENERVKFEARTAVAGRPSDSQSVPG
ncbi:MAG: peroxidase-related enzyme [Bryobacteraceae bacterium]